MSMVQSLLKQCSFSRTMRTLSFSISLAKSKNINKHLIDHNANGMGLVDGSSPRLHKHQFSKRPVVSSDLNFSDNEGAYQKEFMKIWRRSEKPYFFSPGNSNTPAYVPASERLQKHSRQRLRVKNQTKQLSKPITSTTRHGQESNEKYITNQSFISKGVHAELSGKLKSLGIQRPLIIQSLSLPSIFGGKNVIIQSETGSGKTLAYLLPVLQRPGKQCGTLIAVPTRELAHQVMSEAYKLNNDRSIIGCYGNTSQIDELVKEFKSSPPKILIGTPKNLLEIVKHNEDMFKSTVRVVLDEVDKMLPPIIPAEKKQVRNRIRHPKPLEHLVPLITEVSQRRVQLVACSATISRQMVDDLIFLGFGHKVEIIKPNVYTEKKLVIPNCINHKYLTVNESEGANKIGTLVRYFRNSGIKSMLVFIQRGLSVVQFVEELKEFGLEAVAFYKEIESGEAKAMDKFFQDFRSGKIQVAVATEETVRGLDFKGLSDVCLMEVPRSIDEYIHLAGRVGRVGLPGTVTTLVSDTCQDSLDRLKLIWEDLKVDSQQASL